MSINNLSSVNQNLIKNKTNQNNKRTVCVSDNNSKDTFINSHKKELAVFVSILAGVGLTVGTLYLAYKGKFGSKIQGFIKNIFSKFKGGNRIDAGNPTELEKGVKKFFNEENKLVDNVRLENGKAIAIDKPFSGTMGTIDNKGRKIMLEYKNGDLKSSTIDGKLKKTYSTYEEELAAYLGEINDADFKKLSEENLPKVMDWTIIKDKESGSSTTIVRNFEKIDNIVFIADENDPFCNNFKKIEFNSAGQPVKIFKNNQGVVDFVEYFNDGKTKKQQIETLGKNLYKQVKYDLDGNIVEELNGKDVLFDFEALDGIKVVD